MTDVTDINQDKNKQDKSNKSPIDSAVNKIKEGIGQSTAKKIDEKVKAYHEAKKLLNTIKTDLQDLQKQKVVEDLELAELLKELK